MSVVITEPGVYDLADVDYHADPVPGGSASSTMLRHLLPPGCPAQARYDADHPEPKAAFDRGTAAHKLILGKGADLHEVEADSWRTTAAKDNAKAARARGQVPLLSHQLAEAQAMADAVLDYRLYGTRLRESLFAPGAGTSERSVIWRNRDTGAMCRAMLDRFPDETGFVDPIGVDVKTSGRQLSRHAITRAFADHRYDQQEAHYRDGLESVGFAPGVPFLFVVVSAAPPHLVTVVELDEDDVAAARRRNRRALEVWQECCATGEWPTYTDQIVPIRLPSYIREES